MFSRKYGKYLYLSASTDTLLRLADEAELMKETITGTMQKFNYASVNTFLLPGMSKDDIVRYCEGPFLIQDAIKPSLLPYIRTGFIEDIFPLHDLVNISVYISIHYYIYIFNHSCPTCQRIIIKNFFDHHNLVNIF